MDLSLCSSPPSLPSLLSSRLPRHSSPTEGEWILPLSPRASFHIATFVTNAKRSSETAELQSPLRPGAAPDRPAPVTESEHWDVRMRPTPDAALRPAFKTQKKRQIDKAPNGLAPEMATSVSAQRLQGASALSPHRFNPPDSPPVRLMFYVCLGNV